MSKKVNERPSIIKKHFQLQKYTLPGDVLKQAELLLPYKSYDRKQRKQRFLKHLEVKIYDRYKMYNTEMKKKLHEIDDALTEVCAIKDLDKDFFKIVNGRPLSHFIPLYKTLKIILNNGLRTVQEIGYKKDCVLNIENNFKIEKNAYDLSLQRFTEQAKAFDKFIMEDYKKSMKLLEEQETLNVKLEAKISELQHVADESFLIMSRLIGLDYKYSLQQKYGRFLYYLSPSMWRSNNREFARSVEIEVRGFDFGNTNDEDNFTVMFEKMRNECFSALIKPVLYFTQPQDLMDVFNGMETQLLYHFRREQQLVPHKISMNNMILLLKEIIAMESATVIASIKKFKSLLTFCEEQSIQLKEKFFKILHGCFYESVGTAEVLKFILHLEFCYDKVFIEKAMSMDVVTMAKSIESMYMDYSKRLDSIQSGTVRKSMKRCMELENQKIAKAKYAANELRLFRRLEREMLRSHNLLSQEVNVCSKNPHKQSRSHNRSKSRQLETHKQSLTDAEMEYLTLFTDWRKNEDPAMYLQSLNIETEQNNIH